MNSGYFTKETAFPFAEMPMQDLRDPDGSNTYVTLPGSSYGKQVLTACLPHPELDSLMMLPACQIFCLTGVSGVGKRTLALSYAGTVMRTLGWQFLYVKGKELAAEEEPGKIYKAMQKLFAQAAAQPCVLILETGGNEAVWDAAADCCAALLPDSVLTVFLIEDDPTMIKARWTNDLLMLMIPLPERADRECFFRLGERKRENILELSDNRLMRRTDSNGNKVPTIRELADESEGLTFTELKQVIRLIRCRMKMRALEKYGGSANRVVNEGLQMNAFYYDKKMFREAVKTVRDAREACMPVKEQIVLPAGIAAVQNSADPFGAVQNNVSAFESFATDGLTEDQIAEQSVLGRIKIPPNPNA